MDNSGEIKNIIGLLTTATVAAITTAAIGTPIGIALGATLLSGISINLSSGYIERIKYDKIREWIFRPHPDDLNHHLQRALKTSIIDALENIKIKYSSLLKESDRPTLNRLINKLKKEIESNFPAKKEETTTKNDLKNYLYKDPEKAVKDLLNNFPFQWHSLDTLNPEVPFSQYFQDNILIQLQLSFGEMLKEKDNHKIWVAFQRLIIEDVREKVEKVIEMQEMMHRDILSIKEQNFPKISKEQIKELKNLSLKLNRPLELSGEMQNALDVFISSLKEQINEIVKTQKEHLVVSKETNALAQKHLPEINARVAILGDKLEKGFTRKDWLIISSIIMLLLIIICFLMFRFYNQPFNSTFTIIPDHSVIIPDGYPPLQFGAKISVFLHKKRTEELSSSGKVEFNDIEKSFLNSKIKISLDDKFWKFSNDSIILKEGINTVSVVPNEIWSVLEGDVKYFNGKKLNSIAEIHIGNDTIIYTNKEGGFKIKLPINMRREVHEISVYVNNNLFATEKGFATGFIKIRDSYKQSQ